MTSKYQDMVREFNQAIESEYGWKVKALRKELIREEAQEIVRAITAGDPIELIDGLCDLLYVLYGAADIFGLSIPQMAVETRRALEPPLGFDHIRVHLQDFEEALELIFETTDAEHQNLLTYHLANLARGCWLTAADGLGIELAPFFEEVHRTNMKKVGGPRREDGKHLKPPDWKPPRIEDMYAKRKGMPCPEDTP